MVQKIRWFNWMKVTLRSRKTAYIHCTELVWPRTLIVRSWCNRVEWLYGVGLCLPQSRQSAKLFLQSSELAPPTPHPQASMPPHPLVPGGGALSLAREGVGESQFQRGDIHCGTLYIRTLCCLLYCTVLYCTVWPRKLTLRSQISIKWLWPVKVILKVIKRRLLVFCWSCDAGLLKWHKKNCRASSLSLRIEWV